MKLDKAAKIQYKMPPDYIETAGLMVAWRYNWVSNGMGKRTYDELTLMVAGTWCHLLQSHPKIDGELANQDSMNY